MAVLSLDNFKAYVEKNLDEFISEAFLGFKSSDALTHYPDNKGKLTVQDITYNADPIAAWKVLAPADFTQKGDMSTIEIDSNLLQLRDGYVPTELEKTYAGMWRNPGQDPQDFPLAAYFLQEAAKKIRWQIARLVWQAEVGGAGSGAFLEFDGYLHQIADAITATDLTVTTLQTIIARTGPSDAAGAGETAAVDAFETIWDALPEAVKQEGVNIYCSPAMARLYSRDYRNYYQDKPNAPEDIKRMILDIAGEDDARAMIVPVPEMGASNRIIATPQRNMAYTYDLESDPENFNFVEYYNSWHFWSDFRIGGKILHANDSWMAVNELA